MSRNESERQREKENRTKDSFYGQSKFFQPCCVSCKVLPERYPATEIAKLIHRMDRPRKYSIVISSVAVAETTSTATATTNGACYENLGIYSVEIINVFRDNIELIIRCSRFSELLWATNCIATANCVISSECQSVWLQEKLEKYICFYCKYQHLLIYFREFWEYFNIISYVWK